MQKKNILVNPQSSEVCIYLNWMNVDQILHKFPWFHCLFLLPRRHSLLFTPIWSLCRSFWSLCWLGSWHQQSPVKTETKMWVFRSPQMFFLSIWLSDFAFSFCFQASIIQDFENLRVQAEKKGLFKTNPLFFGLHLGHILLLEVLAWLLVWLCGTGWTMTFLCSIILATAQVFRK